MFGKEALNLISELDLSEEIKPFNNISELKGDTEIFVRISFVDWNETDQKFNTKNSEAVFRQVLDEIQTLYEANLEDVNTTLIDASEATRYMSVQFRHAALNRNKRCLLAYVYNRMMRMRKMRWEFGSILPPEINCNLMPLETQWFQAYNKSLATYMKSIGDSHGLDLTMDMVPPKSLYIEVRCLVDYEKLELDDGQIITLKKNTHHLLPRAQCERLVRKGILEHITS